MTISKYEFEQLTSDVEAIPADSTHRVLARNLLQRLRDADNEVRQKEERIRTVEKSAAAVAAEASRLHGYCRYYADRTALIRPLVEHVLKMSLPEMQALKAAWVRDPGREQPEPDILERLAQTLSTIADKE
jgi:hypothetical protein